MNDIQIFNVYKINSAKSVTRYTISRTNGKYKITKRCKNTFPDSLHCIEKILELEDKGYANIDVLLSSISKKEEALLFNRRRKTLYCKKRILKLLNLK